MDDNSVDALRLMGQSIVFGLNKTTIASLESKDFVGAIKSSTTALQHHHTGVAGDEKRKGTETAEEVPPDRLHNCSLDENILYLTSSNENAAPNLSSRHSSFIYESPMGLSHGLIPATLSSTLIFNAALTQHLFAESINVQNRSAYHKTLGKAKKLYKLALTTITEKQGGCDSILFRFIVMNNISAIEQELHVISSMEECFEQMESVKALADLGCPTRLRHLEDFIRKVPTTAENAAAA